MTSSRYADLSRPPLSESALRRAVVVPGGLWSQLRVVPETGSTNADVAAAARAGAAEGLVIVAERQSAGRGRRDRRWDSPPQAGLTFSVLLRPAAVAGAQLGWLPLLAGVALAEAVGRLAQLPVALKWPNDLWVRSGADGGFGKCAGILAEAVAAAKPGIPTAVVVGVGLNVTQRADELPPIEPPAVSATSLVVAGALSTDRDPLLRAILRALAQWYQRWCATGGDADACGLRTAYAASCATLDQPVRVLLPGGEVIDGVAAGVDATGRLVLATATGSRAVAAGEVVHVR